MAAVFLQVQTTAFGGTTLQRVPSIIGGNNTAYFTASCPSGYLLYNNLFSMTGQKYDFCVIDVFLSVVDYMEGGDAKPWWEFTEGRKTHDNRSTSSFPPIHTNKSDINLYQGSLIWQKKRNRRKLVGAILKRL